MSRLGLCCRNDTRYGSAALRDGCPPRVLPPEKPPSLPAQDVGRVESRDSPSGEQAGDEDRGTEEGRDNQEER